MRPGELLTVKIGDRLCSAVLLGVDEGRDYPYEVMVDDKSVAASALPMYVDRSQVTKRHGSVFSALRGRKELALAS